METANAGAETSVAEPATPETEETVQTPEKGEAETPNTEAETPSGEDNTEKTPSDEEKAERRSRHERRLAKKSQQVRELTEQLERERSLNEQLRSDSGDDELPPMPDLSDEDIGYDQAKFQARMAEWMQARSDKAAEQSELKRREVMQKHAQEQLNREVSEQFKIRQEAFADEHSDYYQVVANPAFVQAPHVAAGIQMHEQGPEIAYHLANNPTLTHELNTANQAMAFMRMGALGERLSKPPPVTQSSAPQPSEPVKANGSVTKDPNKMDAYEYRNHIKGKNRG